MLKRALRLFHTVRHLRPIQIIGRLAAKVRFLRLDRGPAPSVRSIPGKWALPAWRAPSMVSPNEFLFLNQLRKLVEPTDWDRADWPRLWVYNLHYFDDLDAAGAEVRTQWHVDLINRWVAENPGPRGTGWEPYCLSIRIVNWCRWVWSGNLLNEAAVQSLALQTRALTKQIEFHLLGNHLFANAKALIFAGLFFEGSEADRWLEIGLSLLRSELVEQILPDGGHFERSPMYHAVIANDVLDLIEADRLIRGRIPPGTISDLRHAGSAMLVWAAAMNHDDGGFAFFNDAAFGVAPSLADLQRMALMLNLDQPPKSPPLLHLQATGYIRAECGSALLLVDAGEVGPDYLPAHAHADTLSFELSLNGRRLLVNTGTSEYVGMRRLYERGSASHNTVSVDGADSSEVWSSFRVARRARPLGVAAAMRNGLIEIVAAHDGFRRLPGRVIHHRSWVLAPDELLISDRLDGKFETADAWFHFHPDAHVTALPQGFSLTIGETDVSVTFDGGEASIVEGFWAPEMGKLLRNVAIRVRQQRPTLVSCWRWG